MGLRDLLRKKDDHPAAPELTIVRSDTMTLEAVRPPASPSAGPLGSPGGGPGTGLLAGLRARSRSGSHGSRSGSPASRGSESAGVPAVEWEARATQLAQAAGVMPAAAADAAGVDDELQTAIRLHEQGKLERSTRLFGRLADPAGANHALAQVLYGLALRHGWGCAPDPAAAVRVLAAAAANAAAVQPQARRAGLAGGDLVLAIYELANCLRNGWGVAQDPVAAKQYYETAANLGDTDAMNEVARCYLEGFGCKKNKFEAARYYRMAEQNGNKTLGNSWIWKDKYAPPSEPAVGS